MAVRHIVQIGEDSLLEPSEPLIDIFSDKTRQIVEDLIDTHKSAGGVGIAAPQIGENFRVFVTELPLSPLRPVDQTDGLRVYINPLIIDTSDYEIEQYEGCLSIAKGDFSLPILRPKEVTVQAFDVDGKKFELKCDGLLARVIFHEYDHLDGVLFIQKNVYFRRAVNQEKSRWLSKNIESLVIARRITLKQFNYV